MDTDQQNKEELQYHLQTKKGDVGRYAILCGDPGRVASIAKYFDDAKEVAYNREFKTMTGTLNGVKISAVSHGLGCPSTDVCLRELINCGADTFIRCGTCGGIDLEVESGDIVVATGAIRFEHTSFEYAPECYPAVPDLSVTNALREASLELGLPTKCGIVQCKDSFYGQHKPETSAVHQELLHYWEAWKLLGVKASEMESSAAFVICSLFRCRCGSCFHTIWNQEREKAGLDQKQNMNTENAIKVAVRAMSKIIEDDKKQSQ